MSIIPFLADLTIGSNSGGLGQALILLVVAVIVLSFIAWVIKGYVPAPMQRWAWLVLALLCVLILCNFVLSMNGHGFIHF